eukprot:m51a1_g11323 putative C-tail anchored protein (640) ;mRNA; r:120544-122743
MAAPSAPLFVSALIKQLFETCDTSSRGKITLDEFRPVAQELAGGADKFPEEAVKEMFVRLGPDPSGYVDFDSFSVGMSASLQQRMDEVFEEFDGDDDGVLSEDELTAALGYLVGEQQRQPPRRVARALLARFDPEGAGGLNRSAFERVFLLIASALGPSSAESLDALVATVTPTSSPPGTPTPLSHKRRASFMSPMLPARLRPSGYILESEDCTPVSPELRGRGLSDEDVRELRRLFESFDTRRAGALGVEELRRLFPESDPGFVMTLLDRNWTGSVEFVEFALAMDELRKTDHVGGVPLHPCKSAWAHSHCESTPRLAVPEKTHTRKPSATPSGLAQQIKVEELELAVESGSQAMFGLRKRLNESEDKGCKLQADLQQERQLVESMRSELDTMRDQLEQREREAEDLRKACASLEEQLRDHPADDVPLLSADADQSDAPPVIEQPPQKQPESLFLCRRASEGNSRRLRDLEIENEGLRRELQDANDTLATERASWHSQEKQYLAELESYKRIVVETKRRERAREMAKQGLQSPVSRPRECTLSPTVQASAAADACVPYALSLASEISSAERLDKPEQRPCPAVPAVLTQPPTISGALRKIFTGYRDLFCISFWVMLAAGVVPLVLTYRLARKMLHDGQ